MADIKKEWKNIFKSIDKKGLKLDQSDIAEEIKAHRKAKHKKSKNLEKALDELSDRVGSKIRKNDVVKAVRTSRER